MNKKGQTAFETLFLAIVIISAAIIIISIHTSINDETIALSTARAETNKQLAMQNENIQINQITIKKNNLDAILTISLSNTINLDEETIENKIIEATKFKNVGIIIN